MTASRDNSVGILQGEIAFTSADAKNHILGSYCTLTCVNMAVYNPKTQQLGFVHIDECAFSSFKNILA